jgi:hypothetical protein
MNWLASSEGSAEDILHVRSSFLMRLFFAGELPPEHTVAMMQNVRTACNKALEDMRVAPESADKYQSMIPTAERAGYWRMVMLFGESYYQAIAQWADSMLSLSEKQIGTREEKT